jgi:hypothetical protein
VDAALPYLMTRNVGLARKTTPQRSYLDSSPAPHLTPHGGRDYPLIQSPRLNSRGTLNRG